MAELLAHNTKALCSYVHKLIANAYVRVLVHALLIMFNQTELMMKKFNCFSYQPKMWVCKMEDKLAYCSVKLDVPCVGPSSLWYTLRITNWHTYTRQEPHSTWERCFLKMANHPCAS